MTIYSEEDAMEWRAQKRAMLQRKYIKNAYDPNFYKNPTGMTTPVSYLLAMLKLLIP